MHGVWHHTECLCIDEVIPGLKGDFFSAVGIAGRGEEEEKITLSFPDRSLCFIHSGDASFSGGFYATFALLLGLSCFHTRTKYSWNLRGHVTSLATSFKLFPLLSPLNNTSPLILNSVSLSKT